MCARNGRDQRYSASNGTALSAATLSDARRFVLGVTCEYHQGARLGNAASVFNPAYRWTFNAHPAAATSQNPWAVSGKPPEPLSKSYFEFTLLYSDRSESQLLSTVSFQRCCGAR